MSQILKMLIVSICLIEVLAQNSGITITPDTQDSSYLTDHRWIGQPREVCLWRCKDDQACLEKCYQKEDLIKWTAGVAIGGFILTTIVVISIFICYTRGICIFWPFHLYHKLKKKFNIISPGSLTPQQFTKKKDLILTNIENSFTTATFFLHENPLSTLSKKRSRIKAHISSTKDFSYLTKVKLEGIDIYSKWKAYGYIGCKNQGQMFLWMYKIYQNKVKSGQIGIFQHLVYESQRIGEDGSISGKWYYVGFQREGGAWSLRGKSVSSTQSVTQSVHSLQSFPTLQSLQIGSTTTESRELKPSKSGTADSSSSNHNS